MEKKHGIYNRLHVLSWIGKDILWNLQWKVASEVLIVPTIIFALIMCKRDVENRLEHLSVLSWIGMNTLWMLHEYYPDQIPKWWSWCLIPTSVLFTCLFFANIIISIRKNEEL